ncbi:MAG: glutamate racemase [Candidatus Saccharimonadales bacterium]
MTPEKKVRVGVFDSGRGGLSFVKAIRAELPSYEVVFRNDESHVPYGTRSLEEIYSFTKPILEELARQGCKAIVVACNTVSTNLIERLREDIPVPLIAVEPMVKPAAENTKTRIIAVCATLRTLESKRYQWLKAEYAQGVEVLEPDCSDWALMIETNRVDRDKVAKTIDEMCDQGADQIVLGCTHYHWIEKIITNITAGRAEVIQPEKAVVAQLKHILNQL